MEHYPLIIGLTGGIASGKTTVTDLFAEQGVPVIDADVIAHQLVQPGKPALEQIKEHFGTDICHPDGTLNRDKLRQHVFSHPTSRKQLEEILHPPIIQTLWAEVAQVIAPYCLLSVPLLIETQLYTQVDRVLVVDCTLETQQKRLKARSSLTDAQIAQILAAQTTREKRLAVATEVINNNSTKEALIAQVTTLHKHYLTLATTHYLKKC